MASGELITYFIAAVWLVNGLVCKVLDIVPRHRQIVARILGKQHSLFLTRAIGFAEILMTVWILSGVAPRLNAIIQIVVIASMNLLEYFLARDLLLWGRLNIIFASLFIFLIYYDGFVH
jgi:hypothetical protein